MLKLIKKISEQKRKDKITPSHVLFIELVQASGKPTKAVRSELNTLYAQNKIEVGETINDLFIKLK